MLKPELLSPAGNFKSLHYALAYGADAVYGGQPRYSLRVRNNEFSGSNLARAILETKAQGKKFYTVVNIAPHNAKLKTFPNDLSALVAMEPDALIMSDPGLIMLTKDAYPEMEIHLSVQANAVNWATVKFWHKLGLSRIILSRELSLGEIKEIREKVPEVELEVFVHGALCIAYSGRCLLSGYINQRDSNQGLCSNMCRWRYRLKEGKENDWGDIVSESVLGLGEVTSKVHLLEEIGRPGEMLPTYEDEHGTYIMNSRDLSAIEHVPSLVEIGVNSLKIEGRTKSHYYVAKTAQAYRKAIDGAVLKKPFDNDLLFDLACLANRGYTDGFLRRQPHQSYQNYERGASLSEHQIFVGEFSGKLKSNGMAEIIVKNKFEIGDKALLITPQGNHHLTIEHLESKNGESLLVAPGDGHIVYINLDFSYCQKDLQYFLLTKLLN